MAIVTEELRNLIVDIARQQVSPKVHANDVNIYTQQTSNSNGRQWCSDFVIWVFDKLDNNFNVKPGNVANDSYIGKIFGYKETANVGRAMAQSSLPWFHERGSYVRINEATGAKAPEKGDIVYLDTYNDETGSYVDHVGIVSEVDVANKKIKYISGNSGNDQVTESGWLSYSSVGATKAPNELFPNNAPLVSNASGSGRLGISGFGKLVSSGTPAPTFTPDSMESGGGNNTKATATAITTANGAFLFSELNIHNASDVDYFKIQLPVNGQSHNYISIVDFDHNKKIALVAPDGSEYSVDDSGATQRINLYGVDAGTYYIRVEGKNGGTGNYKLNWNLLQKDGFENNNSMSAAVELAAGAFQEANLHVAEDVDWYKINLSQTGKSGDSLQFSTVYDQTLELYDSAGTLKTVCDGMTLSLNGYAAGTYYAKVATANGGIGSYKIKLNRAEASAANADRFETNDSMAAATDLAASGSESGLNIHDSNDDDYFKISLAQTGHAGNFVSTSFNHSSGDLDLKLYDSAGALISSSTTSGDTENISLSGLAAGTYYAQVYGYNGATGEYSLAWNAEPGSATAPATNPRRVGSGELLSGAVISGGSQIISRGGTAIATQLTSNASQIVYGTASSTFISGSTEQIIKSGGIASNSILEMGGQIISSGGNAMYTTINSGGGQSVTPGGATTNTHIRKGGVQICNGITHNTFISSGGVQWIEDNASAINTTIYANGLQIIRPGGSAFNVIVSSGGVQSVVNGGYVSGGTVHAGGIFNADAGALVKDVEFLGGTSSASGAVQTVANGAVVSGIVIHSGAKQIVSKGGMTTGTILEFKGAQQVESGGSAINTSVYGWQGIHSGGIASKSIVREAGNQTVLSGGSALNTIISGYGDQYILHGGYASGGFVRGSGSNKPMQYVSSGGVSVAFSIQSGGSQYVMEGVAKSARVGKNGFQWVVGGTATETVVETGGRQWIEGGGVASQTVVKSRAVQNIFKGVATGTIISKGGIQHVAGLASATIISSGGLQSVQSSGITKGGIIKSGGSQIVYLGGLVSGGSALKGAKRIIYGSAQKVITSSGATLTVMTGGKAQTAYMRSGSILDLRKGASANIGLTTISGLKIKVAGAATLTASGTFNSNTVAGSSNAQLNVSGGQTLKLGKSNKMGNVTLRVGSGTLNISSAGNTVAKLATTTQANLNFDLSKATAKGSTYMLRSGQKSAFNGKAAITVGASQQFGVYNLSVNLGYATSKSFSLNRISAATGKSQKALTLKADGKAVKNSGQSYTLKKTGNNLKLTVTGVKGQIKTGNAATLAGTANCDIFYGGSGNNVIRGNGGRDVAVYDTKNWGKDRIIASNMTILFNGVKASDVTRSVVNGDMVIKRKGTNQSITISDWNSSSHKIVFGGSLGQFSKYLAQAKPTATQKNKAYDEVWKKAGMLA